MCKESTEKQQEVTDWKKKFDLFEKELPHKIYERISNNKKISKPVVCEEQISDLVFWVKEVNKWDNSLAEIYDRSLDRWMIPSWLGKFIIPSEVRFDPTSEMSWNIKADRKSYKSEEGDSKLAKIINYNDLINICDAIAATFKKVNDNLVSLESLRGVTSINDVIDRLAFDIDGQFKMSFHDSWNAPYILVDEKRFHPYFKDVKYAEDILEYKKDMLLAIPNLFL